MKPIQLNNHQIEALNNGCTMLWMPINFPNALAELKHEDGEHTLKEISILHQEIIKFFSPLQIGQEYYVQEYAELSSEGQYELQELPESMSIKFKVTDIQVKKVLDITLEQCECICNHQDYEVCYNLLEVDYNGIHIAIDNPYGFLVTIEKGCTNEN